jgi:hypothetical protein
VNDDSMIIIFKVTIEMDRTGFSYWSQKHWMGHEADHVTGRNGVLRI